MAPGMSVARRPLPVSPVSFKPQPKNESARSSTPYRIYSKRKITNLPLKPTLHQAKPFGKPLIGYQQNDQAVEIRKFVEAGFTRPSDEVTKMCERVSCGDNGC